MAEELRLTTSHFGIYEELATLFFTMPVRVHQAYPIANVLQSAAGASAVTAIWSIVLEEICSDVVGSNRMMLPCVLPEAVC